MRFLIIALAYSLAYAENGIYKGFKGFTLWDNSAFPKLR
jgi:hypothetical protein